LADRRADSSGTSWIAAGGIVNVSPFDHTRKRQKIGALFNSLGQRSSLWLSDSVDSESVSNKFLCRITRPYGSDLAAQPLTLRCLDFPPPIRFTRRGATIHLPYDKGII